MESLIGVMNPLNASHRCDACGAQAQAIAGKMSSSSALLFCLHHAKKNKQALKAAGFELVEFNLEGEK